MSRRGIPLESFNLDEREFERCKNWATFIKRYSSIESGIEVDFDNLEADYADGNDEEDESAEDLIEIDLEDEENEPSFFDQSVMQLRTFSSTLIQGKPSRYKNYKYSGRNVMMSLPESEDVAEEEEEEQFDMQSILDQTIPKLVERERKWKESGMLRVLNTFDQEKIERTVGSWLKINNSCSAQPEKRTHLPQPQYDDENDSLHSMETARYVLSNRKKRSSGNCCKTMTIKTYRKLQSKRDALREKYAFPEDEFDPMRDISKQKLLRHPSVISTRLARLAKAKTAINECAARKMLSAGDSEISRLKKRRKFLNKQHVRRCHLNRYSCESSSSDDDFGDDGNDQCSNILRQRPHRRLQRSPYLPYCRRSEIFNPLPFSSIGSSMHSPATGTQIPSLICNQLAKPKKRASECCCYNKKKLCHRIDHLADSSTEDWLVENCDSAKKPQSIGKVKNSVQPVKKLKSTSKSNQKPKARKIEKGIRKNKNTGLNGLDKKDVQESGNDKEDEQSGNELQLDCTFERELKLAVELSKQSYEIEVNRVKGTLHDDPIDRKAKKTKSKKSKKAENQKKSKVEDDMASLPIEVDHKKKPMKMSTNIGTKNSTSGPTDALITCQEETNVEQSIKTIKMEKTFENSCKQKPEIQTQEMAIKANSNVAERNEKVTLLNAALAIDEISPARFGIKPQPKSLKIKKVKKILENSGNANKKEDETFFTRADKICNSTAVPDDAAALKKQFPVTNTPSEQSIKPETLVHIDLTATNTNKTKDATLEDDDDDDDCFLVTSTTEDLEQKAEIAAIDTNNSSSSKNNNNSGRQDIMLYTPGCRDLAPMNSISDGVFNITEEYLSTFIGKKSARKFMKYYIGRRRFDANLTVYYRPPRNNCLDADNDTDSDVDELEQLNRYGELYVSFEEAKDK